MNKYQEAFERLVSHIEQLQKFQLVDDRTFNKGSYEQDKETIKELVNKATPKKPRGIKKDRCSICGSYNEIFSKRRNTVAHDIVYCWHCGNAIELE